MILAQNTPIALLDEPTAHRSGFSADPNKAETDKKEDFLVVLHDLTTAVACADDLLVLDQGKLIFSGTKEACLEKNILEDVFRLQRYTFEEQNGCKIFFLPK